MKVFVDTNVWLSGRFRPGLCAELLETLVEENVEILLDERVIEEFRRIAHDKLKVGDVTLARAEVFFRHYARVLLSAVQPTAGIPDSDDAWIIAAALAADVDLFVTGDKLLQEMHEISCMPIVSPRTAFQRLRGLV